MHFVLDQNFPHQATSLSWPPAIQVSHLRAVAPSLIADHEDWQIFLALAQRGDVEGFVTNDADILNSAREMVALSQTNLVLVVTDAVGHDAIRATGLIMVYLDQIARQMAAPSSKRPLIYLLRPGPVRPVAVDNQISKLAQREHITWSDLVRRERAIIGAS